MLPPRGLHSTRGFELSTVLFRLTPFLFAQRGDLFRRTHLEVASEGMAHAEAHAVEEKSCSGAGEGADDLTCLPRNDCLVRSLRWHGVPLANNRDGPFRALQHGNSMLAPFHFCLVCAVRLPSWH